MAEFDREQLKAAIAAGKIPVSDDNIRRLDGSLRALAQQFRARKVAREQGMSAELTRLEETKSFLEGRWDTEALTRLQVRDAPDHKSPVGSRPGRD